MTGRNTNFFLIMTAVWLCLSSITVAVERHVPSQYSTIQAAIDAASSGDTILVEAGTYSENLDFKGKAISLQSISGPSLTTIRGNGGTVVTMGGPGAGIIGFTITGGKASYGAGIKVSGSNTLIRGNIFDGNVQNAGGFGAAIGGNSASPIIEKNIFCNNTSDNQWSAGVVSFVNSSSPVIRNNIFENNNSNAIVLTLPSGNRPRVTNNTIVNNRIGIRVDTRVSQKTQVLRNNILVANQNGLRIENGWESNYPIWEYNLVFGNNENYVGIKNQTGIAGNIDADPHFINPAISDFHLLPDSPCINAGDPDYVAEPDETDIDGEPRILRNRVDIGADEYNGSLYLLVPSCYPTIQSAIDAAVDGDTVIVAPGAYTGDGNRDIDFLGKAITIRSIDPNDPNVVASTIIDCQGTFADRCRGFHFHNNEDKNSILTGLTITNGYTEKGGGIRCYKSSPTVTHCIFSNNSAGDGGGMYNDYSSPTVEGCTFSANSAGDGAGMSNLGSSPIVKGCTFSANIAGYYGGGMHNLVNSSPMIEGCTFTNNSAYYGGGIRNSRSILTVEDCIFTANLAERDGGGISNEGNSPTMEGCTFSGNSAYWHGGGISNEGSSPTVEGCTFSGNLAKRGGGIYNKQSSPTVKNCTFSSNSARQVGGGMCNNYFSNPILTNCIFVQNLADHLGGGMYSELNSSPMVTNCILWADVPSEIYGDAPTVTYSNVQGGWEGEGNIDVDPCFVAPDRNDFHLLPDSPCIDAGDPNSYFGLEPEPDGGRINMGAYGNTPQATCKAGLVLQSYNLVSKTRIGRTEFEYIYTMTLNNNSSEGASNVIVELLNAPNNITILDPDVNFAYIAAGGPAVSDDTFSIIVDRAIPVDATIISWRATFDTAGGGGTGQTMFTTAIILDENPSDIIGDGDVDFEDMAELVERWLWVGPAGSIPEDIVEDGIVNFADFALLAENWGM